MIRALILALLALTLSVIARPKPPVTIHAKNPYAPPQLNQENQKSVLVIGGGLAGLSAALELSERGYQVTIREKSQVLGGRLDAHPKPIRHAQAPLKNSTTFNVEHGFHAFFNNYFTLRDIRKRLGIDHHFSPWDKVQYIFRDYKPESIASEGPYPLNMLNILLHSPNIKLDAAIKRYLFTGLDIVNYIC
jgi:isorenieratene synthase